jgi:hypothetical protein
MNIQLSVKHLQITKANSAILIAVSLTAFMLTFSVVSCRALLIKRSYQAEVIKQKTIAKKQLDKNVKAAESLAAAYKSFVDERTNILNGRSDGTGDRDGDNARIILDALPSKYDFPALATSLEKILATQSYKLKSITGTDDELLQSENTSSPTPVPAAIPFEFSVEGNYTSIQDLFLVLERSIRPIQITKLNMSGTNDSLTVSLNALTYYQPEKNLTITKKDVE